MDFHGAVGIPIFVSAFCNLVCTVSSCMKVILHGTLHKNLRLRVKSGRDCSIPFCCHIGAFQKVEGLCSIQSPESNRRDVDRTDQTRQELALWNGKS